MLIGLGQKYGLFGTELRQKTTNSASDHSELRQAVASTTYPTITPEGYEKYRKLTVSFQ